MGGPILLVLVGDCETFYTWKVFAKRTALSRTLGNLGEEGTGMVIKIIQIGDDGVWIK